MPEHFMSPVCANAQFCIASHERAFAAFAAHCQNARAAPLGFRFGLLASSKARIAFARHRPVAFSPSGVSHALSHAHVVLAKSSAASLFVVNGFTVPASNEPPSTHSGMPAS